ncbi:MAG: hypothetical protein ACR2FY_03700 [Pirellulaceae bacterium]
MLTGEIPMGRFAPPSQKVQIDIRIDEIVLRSLEKEPARRYQHASEVKTEIEAVTSSPRSPLSAGASIATLAGDIAGVKRQLNWPGNGLVVGGVLGLLFCLFMLAFNTYGFAFSGSVDYVGGLFLCLLIEFPWSILVLFAGMKILRMESHRLSRAGTCLALLPISPASILTIPMGLWGFSILSSRQAREAYRRKELLYASEGGAPSPIPQATSTPLPPLPTWEQTKVRVETPTASFVPVVAKPANSPDAATQDSARLAMQGPGFGLIVGGVLAIIAPIGWLVFMLLQPVVLTRMVVGWPDWQLFVGYSSTAILVSLPFAVLMILGGVNMRQLRSYRMAWLGGIAAVVPFCVGWPLSLPFGLWVLVTLLRPEVKSAFGEPVNESAASQIAHPAKPTRVEQDIAVAKRGLYWPGLGLQMAGIIGFLPLAFMLGAVVVVLLGNVVDSANHDVWARRLRLFFDDMGLGPAWFAMLVQVPSSIFLLISGRAMRHVVHYRLALIGGIVAMIPCGPAWLISLPLGIWAVVVLTVPEVRQAFRNQPTA